MLEENALVVGLGEITQFDPTLLELADLPRGRLRLARQPRSSLVSVHG